MKVRRLLTPLFASVLLASVFFSLSDNLSNIHANAAEESLKPFSDLPSNLLYKPFIETFQKENIIVGYTQGGEPTGVLGPKDQLKRSEFTKVAALVRLMETKNDPGQYSGIGLNEFTLKTDTLLRYYYKAQPPAPHFTDVPDKDVNCARNPSGCEPWFTQYVNYAASKGMVKGYRASDGSLYFDPNATILRIHALKLIIAENGNLVADQDPRFQRLANDPRIQNRLPRCLSGAEDYILQINGGYTADNLNLLAYALLADMLDLFGNRCQVFDEAGATTPYKRALFLHAPVTRQEIPRYFALTTTYGPLVADLSSDSTTDTKEEYLMPVLQEGAWNAVNVQADKLGKLTNLQKPNAVSPDAPQEIVHENYYTPPVVTIGGCDQILTDRANSGDMVQDCVKKLAAKGFSDDEIYQLLAQNGLLGFVDGGSQDSGNWLFDAAKSAMAGGFFTTITDAPLLGTNGWRWTMNTKGVNNMIKFGGTRISGIYNGANPKIGWALDYGGNMGKGNNFHINLSGKSAEIVNQIKTVWNLENHQVVGPKNINLLPKAKPVNVGNGLRMLGRAALVAGVAMDAYSIYTAEDKPREITKVAGGWAGASAGAWGGAALGAACGPGAVVCSPVFGFLGGAGGYVVGSGAGEVIYDNAGAAVQGFSDASNNFGKATGEITATAVQGFSDTSNAFGKMMGEAAQSMVSNVANAASSVVNAATGAATAVADTASSAVGAMGDAANAVGGAVGGAVTGAADAIGGFFGSLW